MEEKKCDVVVAGHLCIDILPDLSHVKLKDRAEFLRPGATLVTGNATTSTGGPVSNTGLNLIKLGMKTELMGKVGEDAFGDLVPIILREYGGGTDGLIRDPGVSTSYTIVLTPAGFDRMFLHNPGANDSFTADDINYDLVARSRHFHFGYPPLMRTMYEDAGDQLSSIFRRVKELGVSTSLDMAMPDPRAENGQADWETILTKTLPYVDIFLPSAEEILYMLEKDRFMEWQSRSGGDHLLPMFSGDDLHRLSGRLLDMGAHIACIKCGPRGFYARTPSKDVLQGITGVPPADPAAWADREWWHPTFHMEGPPAATGSGDSSIAGFLSTYLRGLDLEECLIRATSTGTCNVMRPDALSGVKTWEDLSAALDAGWQTDPLEVTGEGWTYGEPREPFWSRSK